MKKINYEIVGRFENGSKYGVMSKKTVEGQQIDEYAAVRKNDWKACPWTVDSFETGIAIIPTGCRTRKEAIEKYEEMKNAVVKILEDEDKMKKMMEQKAKAVPETELAKYEEKNITVLHDWRKDKIQHEAKKTGCIVKQDGEHVKIYGTAAMLHGVNELLKKWEDNEMKNETTATKDTKPEKIDVSKLNADNLKEYLPALLMSLANDKHNSSIILAAGIEAGAIPPVALLDYFTTGRMPAVHTFDVWQKAGYNVKKGEKHAFEARIWKYTEKKAGTYTEDEAAAINSMVVNADGSDMVQAGDEKTSHDFIKKTAYFFTFAQVEKAPELQPLPELPEDVKKESRGGCCWISGNTYAIKDALKAAGFRWSKKNNAWYRREAA
jgi:hypothetical protein